MDINELVKIRNQLQAVIGQVDFVETVAQTESLVRPITNELTPAEYTEMIDSIFSKFTYIKETVPEIQTLLETLTDKITNDITTIADDRYASFSTDNRGIVEPWITDEALNVIIGRISFYVSWRFPGMQLACKDSRVTQSLVSADPLYLIDQDSENIDKTKSVYNEVYQRRLRNYRVDELGILPKNQFSCIVSIDFFNYLNFEQSVHYLTQIFELLRPGGAIILTYNNCELEHSAKMVVEQSMSWNTYTQLAKAAEEIGYIVSKSLNIDNDHPWYSTASLLELSKPGQLISFRGHQTLGQIIPK